MSPNTVWVVLKAQEYFQPITASIRNTSVIRVTWVPTISLLKTGDKNEFTIGLGLVKKRSGYASQLHLTFIPIRHPSGGVWLPERTARGHTLVLLTSRRDVRPHSSSGWPQGELWRLFGVSLVTNSVFVLLFFHKSGISVKKCDFYKQTIKVCICCSWPETCGPPGGVLVSLMFRMQHSTQC